MVDYVIDIETDGLDARVIHCMSVLNTETNSMTTYADYKDMKVFINSLSTSDRIIGHNFIRYDAPIIERILLENIPCKLVDTLALSWYLYPERLKHGLEQWGTELGIKKVEVEDWIDSAPKLYQERCEQDVRINVAIWKKFSAYLNYLYDNKPERLLRYLSFKMDCAMEQESVGWGLDTKAADNLARNLSGIKEGLTKKLEKALPKVGKYVMRKKPTNMYKKNGELSVAGERWKKLCELHGFNYKVYVGTIKELYKWEEPNASSTPQIKDWLKSLGWKPKTFKYPKDKEKVPQIKDSKGKLCKSVIDIAEKNNKSYNVDLSGGHYDTVNVYNKTGEAILALGSLAVVSHRLALVKSLIKNATWTEGHGWRVKAEVQGLTNTLRFKHKTCVNIPSTRAEYGKDIRALFTATNIKNTLCGSDMSSLEDRTKQHYMWEYDPDYVKEMQVEGFDPHLDLAFSAGVVTEEDINDYKYGTGGHLNGVSDIRHAYKGGNYACTYGCGVTTLARQLDISKLQAEEIHTAYWKRNWSIKEIAAAQTIKEDWLYNPVSKLYYKVREEKDIFSTLNQGTGVYCFDLWIKFLREKGYKVNAQFHDEIITEVKDTPKDIEDTKKDFKKAVHRVNELLQLNRELDCDVQFGNNYSEIH